MLILRILSRRSTHGFGISQKIRLLSEEVLQVGEGSLYPALYRLQAQGWVDAEWGQSENNRRAKFYSLTESGRRQLEVESLDWERMCLAIARVMAWT